MSEWSTLGTVGWDDLKEARLQAHYAARWLAKAARNFVPAEADDSHTALTWDKDLEALMMAPITGGAGTFRLGLRVNDLALLVEKDGGAAPSPLLGHTDRQVEARLSAALMLQFVDRDLAINFPGLPYEMPPHPIADGANYGEGLADGALETLSGWFAAAADLVQAVHSENDNASPVRCWPHHFDIATLISLDEGGGEEARSIGLGLSPGDETYAEPYLYVTPWPYPAVDDLPPLSVGQWHREGFTAAVLRGPEIAAGAGPHTFVEEALDACRSLLD